MISPIDLPEEENKAKKFLLIGLIIILIGSLIGGGIIVSRKALQKPPELVEEEIEAVPTEELRPEDDQPLAEDKTALKIKALNGSGEPGAAGVAAQFLTNQGYSEQIDTGNAGVYDYQQTVIQIKEDKEAYLEGLKADLEKEYTVSEDIETLDEDSEFDAIIIVGAK